MTAFCMPSLGADMERGRVIEWLVGPGDRVKRGDVVVVVETDKGAIEVEIWQDGVIDRVLVERGEVPVGTPIAEWSADRAADDAATASDPVAPLAPTDTDQPPASDQPLGASDHSHRIARDGTAPSRAAGASRHVLASPRARRLAETLDVDLCLVRGSGPGGSVTARDVERTVGEQARKLTGQATPRLAVVGDRPAAAPEHLAATGMRHAIAQLMARSKYSAPEIGVQKVAR